MKQNPRGMAAEEIRDLVGVGPLMLEIGCHDGTDTRRFLSAMPQATIHCFEPDPRPLKRFWENVDFSRRVALHPVAIGDLDGQVEFYASTGKANNCDDWDYSGSICRPTHHLKRSPEIGFKDPVPVDSIRLDTWLESVDGRIVDFIWADVQGAQMKLIEGGAETLARSRYLYIECHQVPLYAGEPTPEGLVAALPGFEPLAGYAAENILFRNPRLTRGA